MDTLNAKPFHPIALFMEAMALLLSKGVPAEARDLLNKPFVMPMPPIVMLQKAFPDGGKSTVTGCKFNIGTLGGVGQSNRLICTTGRFISSHNSRTLKMPCSLRPSSQ